MSQRKSVAFQFSTNPDSIVQQDLNYAMYGGDAMPMLSKTQLIDLIKNEYQVQLGEIESTIESLRTDRASIEKGQNSVQDCYQKLFQLERKLGDLHHEVKENLDQLQTAKADMTSNTAVYRNQISDLTDVRKTLQEQQAKEAKSVDKDKLTKLAEFMKRNDENISFIVDNISCMLAGEQGQTYEKTQEKFWSDPDTFALSLRRMDNQKMDRGWHEDLMKSITGSSPDGGAVAKALVDPANIQDYLPFYCLFKLLSKMVYCSMTERKEINLKRKITAGGSSEDQVQARIDSCQARLDALAVRDTVKMEMERMYEGEKGWLESKLAKTDAEIAKYQNMKENLVSAYFGDLPGAS